MTDISKNWLDLSVNSNILKRTYFNGFIDVSKNIVGRKNIWIKNEKDLGDTRLGLGTVDPSFMIDIMNYDPKIRLENTSINSATQNDTNLGTINMISPSNNNITSSTIRCQNIDDDYDDNGSLIFSTGGGNNNANDCMVLSQDIVTFGVSNLRGFADYTNENTNCRIYGNLNSNTVNGFGTTPLGGIIMWSGSLSNNSPIINGVTYTNWKLCNGQNGTPDLRNRFLVGYGSDYNYKTTGGANTVSLTTTTMPSHSHTVNSSGSHSHRIRVGEKQHGWDNSVTVVGADDHSGSARASIDYTDYNAFSHTHTINNTGSGTGHENRPAFYALAFIMRIQ